MVGGQPAKAEINAVPVDAQENEEKRTISSPNYSGGNNRNLSEPIWLYLPAGRYQLKVLSTDHFYHQEQAFPEQVELITVQPGLLELDIVGEHNEKLTRVAYGIKASGKKNYIVGQDDSVEDIEGPPFRVRLLPGDYDLHVYRKLSKFNASGKSTPDISPVMGKDEQQIIRGIRIRSGQTIEKNFVFK